MIMRGVKIASCCASFIIFLFSALLLHVVGIVFPRYRWKMFSHLNKLYAWSLGMIAGVRVAVKGKENIPRLGGYLLISNHLTYLDGVVLGSIFAVIYLSKKAIKKWPGINWMASVSGTIFVDRERKSASPKSVDDIALRLRQGANVLLFPEGTSTNGDRLKEFQSVFFAAPLTTRSLIVPVVIRYRRVNDEPVTHRNRERIYWWGQIPFQRHLYQLLQMKSVEVEVAVLPSIATEKFQNSSLGRKELTRYAYDIINAEHGTSE